MRSWTPAPLLSLFTRDQAPPAPASDTPPPGDDVDVPADGAPVDASGAQGDEHVDASAPAARPAAEIVLEASQLMTEVLDRAMIRAIGVSTAIELLGGTDGAFVRGHGPAARWVPDVPTWVSDPVPTIEPNVARALATGQPTARAADLPDGRSGMLAAAPVLVDGLVIGALVVVHEDGPGFPPDATDRLALLTPVIGTALGAADVLLGATTAAEVDALTGLPNRRRLDADLALLRRDELVAFAMLDIDHFKQFNDVNGHGGGDAALRAVADAVATSLRPGDIAYRYGGEEMAVVLRGCDAEATRAVMDRVHDAIRRLAVEGATTQPLGHLSVSIGIASSADGAVSTLLARADAALYAAKATGRDRTVVAAPPVA